MNKIFKIFLFGLVLIVIISFVGNQISSATRQDVSQAEALFARRTYSQESMREIIQCTDDYKTSLKEYANIIDEIQRLTQSYGSDYDSLIEKIDEIARIVDIGDPYSPIYDCMF